MAYKLLQTLDEECGCAVSLETSAVIVDMCKKHKTLKRPLHYAIKLINKLIKEQSINKKTSPE